MLGALTVAGLAPYADLGKGGCVPVICRVVVLPDAGRVALRTHEIPVLVQLGPVQHVVVAYVFVRIEMKPALAALILRPRVPGNR